MKNLISSTKNRCKLYVGIIVGSFIVTQIISTITGISTENTWLGLIGINIIFLMITIMLIDIFKATKVTHPHIARFLKPIIFAIITSVVFVHIIIFVIET